MSALVLVLFTIMTQSHYCFVNSLNDCVLLMLINISESKPNPLQKRNTILN